MHKSRKNPKKRNRNPFPHSLAALALFPWQQKREIKNDLLALKSPNALINIGSIHTGMKSVLKTKAPKLSEIFFKPSVKMHATAGLLDP